MFQQVLKAQIGVYVNGFNFYRDTLIDRRIELNCSVCYCTCLSVCLYDSVSLTSLLPFLSVSHSLTLILSPLCVSFSLFLSLIDYFSLTFLLSSFCPSFFSSLSREVERFLIAGSVTISFILLLIKDSFMNDRILELVVYLILVSFCIITYNHISSLLFLLSCHCVSFQYI